MERPRPSPQPPATLQLLATIPVTVSYFKLLRVLNIELIKTKEDNDIVNEVVVEARKDDNLDTKNKISIYLQI